MGAHHNQQLSPYDLGLTPGSNSLAPGPNSAAALDYAGGESSSYGAAAQRAPSQGAASSSSSTNATAEADAISALTSLAQNPQGISTVTMSSSSSSSINDQNTPNQNNCDSAAINGQLMAKDPWGSSVSTPVGYSPASLALWGGYQTHGTPGYTNQCVNGDLGALWGYPGAPARPRPQFHLHEIFPDVMKSIDQKLVELEAQKRTWNEQLRPSSMGAFTAPQQGPAQINSAAASGYQQSSQGMAGFRPAGFLPPPPAAHHHVNAGFGTVSGQQQHNYFQQNVAMNAGTNWRRFMSAADQLAYPPSGLGPGLQNLPDWQLSTILARHQTSSLAASGLTCGSSPILSPAPSLTYPITVATGNEDMSTKTTCSNGYDADSKKSSPELSGAEKAIVVKDLEKTFGYRLPKTRKRSLGAESETDSEYYKELQNYHGFSFRSFMDRNFECRPFANQIPLYDGSFEDEDSRKHRLDNNTAQKADQCKCLGSEVSEEMEGPYYTHLGAAPSVPGLRKIMEERFGVTGEAIRMEKVQYTGKEGRTQDGCPIAKWVIRRSGLEEKILCVIRERPSHKCATAVLCVCIVMWEGVPQEQADDLYSYLVRMLPTGGMPTNRRCALNDQRSCACQGMNDVTGGASFSFGCSWSMYYNTCKFARSRNPKRFKLLEAAEEPTVEQKLQELADIVAHQYSLAAPAAYKNQVYYSYRAQECRLGNRPGGPFTGVTACVDFCSHSHRDVHNMSNGCTVVASLCKHRDLKKPEDEQFHVLPLYVPAKDDEFRSEEAQKRKMQNGQIEVLNKYPMTMRYRREPLPNCKERNKRACPAASSSSALPSPGPPIKQEPMPQMVSPNAYYPHGNYSPFPAFHPGAAYSMQSHQSPYPATPNGFYSGWAIPAQNQYPAAAGGHQQYPEYPWPPKMEAVYDPVTGMMVGASPRRASYGGDGGPECSNQAAAAPVDPDAPPEGFYTIETDNDHAFSDSQIGGVAIAVGHGSILFEVAKKELHATTALKRPDRRDPKRISMVFYQHKNLNFMNHGYDEWDRRLALKKQGKVDEIATARAQSLKQKHEVKLPNVAALPLVTEYKIPANRELSRGTESVLYKSTKADVMVVDPKQYRKRMKKETESDQAAEGSKMPPGGVKMEDLSG